MVNRRAGEERAGLKETVDIKVLLKVSHLVRFSFDVDRLLFGLLLLLLLLHLLLALILGLLAHTRDADGQAELLT